MEFLNPLSCEKDIFDFNLYASDYKNNPLKSPMSWSVWSGELSHGDIPTFGLNGFCHLKGYDFRVLCLKWNTIITNQCFEQEMVQRLVILGLGL